MKTYRLALLPGDGIGKEVIPAAVHVLKAAAQKFALSFQPFDWGCEYYLRHGRMMPEDGLETLRPFDAILLGAIGSMDLRSPSSSRPRTYAKLHWRRSRRPCGSSRSPKNCSKRFRHFSISLALIHRSLTPLK
jgi:isocitrate/isopropylmalate dehydrogenase